MSLDKDFDMEEDAVDTEKEQELNNEKVEQIFDENETTEVDAPDTANVNGEDEQPNEVSLLNEQIEKLQKELDEKENRLLRIQADYDNYRKRTKNEREAIEKYRSETLAKDLLNTIDNFERALQTNVTSDDAKALLQGVELVYKNIIEVFKKEGIEPIEAVGKEFDPHEHHAVMQGQDDQYESNIVLEELQKGYKLKDRVIRPAMVKVNQ